MTKRDMTEDAKREIIKDIKDILRPLSPEDKRLVLNKAFAQAGSKLWVDENNKVRDGLDG